jgi:hypothetical protein
MVREPRLTDRLIARLAVGMVVGGLVSSLLGFGLDAPFAGALPLQLRQIGGLAIGLAFGAIAIARPARTSLGLLATASCAVGALGFDAVALIKLYTQSDQFSSLRWGSEATTLGGAAIALALAARPVTAKVALLVFAVFAALAVAALVVTLFHEADRSRFSSWFLLSGALVAVAVTPALTRFGAEVANTRREVQA